MEYVVVFLAVLFALTGLLGSVLPVLPGTPVSYIALLLLLLCDGNGLSATQLIVLGVIALLITVIDYIAPIWFTKKSGGSKYGTWGATVGLLLGFFMGPIGVIAGPFLGAFVGELFTDTPPAKAFRIACMTFIAFMLTSGIKIIYGVYLLVLIFVKSWDILFQ